MGALRSVQESNTIFNTFLILLECSYSFNAVTNVYVLQIKIIMKTAHKIVFYKPGERVSSMIARFTNAYVIQLPLYCDCNK